MNPQRTGLKLTLFAALAALALLAALGWARPALAGDKLERRGKITQLPPGGGAGTWVVDGVTFTADGSTQFDVTEGPLVLNGCAKVAYVVQGSANLAQEIDSEPASDCGGGGGGGGGGGDDDGDSDGGNHDIEIFGVLQSRPAAPAVLGTWTVSTAAGNRAFTADADTEFEQEYGALLPGICVEVEADTPTPTVAEKIESEPAYKCLGSDDDGHTEFHEDVYGTVTAIPNGGLGEWTIGGNGYQVTAATILEGRGSPIGVGTYVEVYFRQEGSVRTALKIEAKFNAGGGDDGNHGTEDGQTFGIIESFPPQLTGVWVVSGVRYTATQQTAFQQNDGAFAQGKRVKVEYTRNSQGQLIAKEIETTGDNGGVADPAHARLAGYVTAKPAGFVGRWEVNGQPFEAGAATTFKEDHGMLALNAFVVVEYSTLNGQRLLHEIETAVAPGAGDDVRLGAIEARPGRAGAGAAGATAVWRIGGVDFAVTAATDLNNTAAPLAVGSTALVNSYQAADGSQVATRIQGFTVVSSVYLPLAVR